MTAPGSNAVLLIGGRGEFGQFLRRDILPVLGVDAVTTAGRDTPRAEYLRNLHEARHIVLSTPLADYMERACELTEQCQDVRKPTTIWLISSVQAQVWRAITGNPANNNNPYLAFVFVHPMYGPNGFRANEQEARTFRNILTAIKAGSEHPLADEVFAIFSAFQSKLSIETNSSFDPEAHDRITAYSQGLSYCIAQLMFARPEIDEMLRERMPDLHHSFHANRRLIVDFMRTNAYIPEALKIFGELWERTTQPDYGNLLRVFAAADQSLNGADDSPIPTKWYRKLRDAAVNSSR